MPTPERPPSPPLSSREINHFFLVVGLGVLALGGALFAFLIAALTRYDLCGDGVPCHPNGLQVAQYWVALAGFVPVLLLWFLLARRQWALAAVSFAVGLVVYLGWGILNDAAVHGWDNLKVF